MKKFLDINDVTICIDDTDEDKKPIILIPGLASSKEAMFFIRDALKDDYRVITLDVRGHGESTHPLSYTLEDHAEDLQEIIGKLQLQMWMSLDIPWVHISHLGEPSWIAII